MLLEATPYSIELATPFVISRGARTHCHTVRVTVSHDHQQGIGECTPYPRYGESVESVIAQIESWTSDLVQPFTTRSETALTINASRRST